MTSTGSATGAVRIFISTADTARLLGVDEHAVVELVVNGRLTSVDDAGEWLVEAASVIEYARAKDNA